jgi:alkanesulfonate monooxygenase SsuD/methylene tetrahydromethanopterin reductase-like flavin-dependent oxidoreductase (luciferase family)
MAIGVAVIPSATDPDLALSLVEAADDAGLDMVGVQDHPYLANYLDVWSFLAFAGARTRRITLMPDVSNLPLRGAPLIAKAAASLDLLTGGRAELGLGAGFMWDGIEAMGGPRRTGPVAVDAIEEAIPVIRAIWAGREGTRVDGDHYRLAGLDAGPRPAHAIGIWIGAYGDRLLRVTGRLADGWLPSLGFMPLEDAERRQRIVDEAAQRAGRDRDDIRRFLNLGPLDADPAKSAEFIGRLVDLRFDGFFLPVGRDDPIGSVRWLGEEVAPRVRQLVG